MVPRDKVYTRRIPVIIGDSIPMKATFFITYIMVDGWAGIAGELPRFVPLVLYRLRAAVLVKTEKDKDEAMDPGSIGFHTSEPRLQLYFILGLVYAVVTPLILPFLLVYFILAYVIYRHQIINVYNQQYESGAAFWPDVHKRLVTALVISQVLLMGLMSTKEAAQSTPLLLALPILTFYFNKYCKNRFEPAFVRYPLQEAMMKDTLEHARDPTFDLKGFLSCAYANPAFRDVDCVMDSFLEEPDSDDALVPTKRQSQRNTPAPSKYNGSSPARETNVEHGR